MMSKIQILLPVLPSQEIYIRGYIFADDCNNITIYITECMNNKELLSKKFNNSIFGYIGHNFPRKIFNKYDNIVHIKHNSLGVNKLIINGVELTNIESSVVMIYDYDIIKDSQTICISNDDSFSKLVDIIHNEHGHKTTNHSKPNFKGPHWINTSMFLQHIYNYWRLLQWLFKSFKTEKLSIKYGNLILAIIMDLILGYVALHLLPQENEIITSSLMGVLERLINFLYSLLKWLMGAPVGLKLNNAFNNMLGKYFSYHVQLWWLFLDVSGEKLHIILHIYNYIGYLGLTFQIAVISDLICLATFHSYCIYVYAARLFNIQISGLIALLRLFVGRKYNPLRGGIDSCEYTNQELFVGTVAFTMLLLLLPTTALYYVVFTGFRMVSLVVQNILAKLIHFIQTSPIYATFLWFIGSPKVKGNISMEVLNEDKNSALVLRLRLTSNSIAELVRMFKPPVNIPKRVEWSNMLSNILVGKQIV